MQILARADRLEEGLGRGMAFAVLLRHLIEADALGLGRVEIGAGADLHLARGLDEVAVDGRGVAQRGDRQWPGAAMKALIHRRIGIGLGTPEIGQERVVIPTRAAQRRPLVVIRPVAADVDHAVDRRGPAQHLAARDRHLPPVQPLLRGRGIEPVVPPVLGQQHDPQRHPDQRRAVAWSGLDQADADGRVLRQAIRQNGAGRARADDHVIEAHRRVHRRGLPPDRRHRLAQPLRRHGFSDHAQDRARQVRCRRILPAPPQTLCRR